MLDVSALKVIFTKMGYYFSDIYLITGIYQLAKTMLLHICKPNLYKSGSLFQVMKTISDLGLYVISGVCKKSRIDVLIL